MKANQIEQIDTKYLVGFWRITQRLEGMASLSIILEINGSFLEIYANSTHPLPSTSKISQTLYSGTLVGSHYYLLRPEQ